MCKEEIGKGSDGGRKEMDGSEVIKHTKKQSKRSSPWMKSGRMGVIPFIDLHRHWVWRSEGQLIMQPENSMKVHED